MVRRDASAIFRSVLVLSAVASACGGAVEGASSGSSSSSGCPEGKTCPYASGLGDADAGAACALDCDAICTVLVASVVGGFRTCWRMDDGGMGYRCGACGVGRVPSDTTACPLGETIGERLARQAYHEAVSVVAFERLSTSRSRTRPRAASARRSAPSSRCTRRRTPSRSASAPRSNARRAALAATRQGAAQALDAPGVAIGLPAPARARRMLDLVIDALAA